MNSQNSSFLFNLTGGGIIVFVVGYMLTSFFAAPEVPLCSRRFPAGIQMSYADSSGQLLSPLALEARSNTRNWGFSSNATTVPVEHEQFTNALQVQLAPAEVDESSPRNGVGFVWRPKELADARAACLSYSVFIPSNFTFPETGRLPGLFGTRDISQVDELNPDDTFVARPVWQPSGDVGVDVRNPSTSGFIEGAQRKTVWPTGRWVAVEQEVQLNTRNEADGVLRTWIDGKLTFDRSDMTLRAKPEGGISGIMADIGYAQNPGPVAALRISPFIVRWQ